MKVRDYSLVLSQFACASYIVLTTRWSIKELGHLGVREIVALAGWLFVISGSVLAIWAWFAMGLSRIRISPQPASDIQLVVRPPYKWIRHPMYSGLIVACCGLLLVHCDLWRLLTLLLLITTLFCKARVEEQLLVEKIPAYKGYLASSGRFLPVFVERLLVRPRRKLQETSVRDGQ